MSEEIGASLPPPLRFELGAHPTGDAAKAVLLVTVDGDGSSRVAVIAPAQLQVRDGAHIGFALHTTSSACANVKRSAKAALWCVLDAAAYCIRGEVKKTQGNVEPGWESFELEITSVLRDFESTAPMVSGPTYRRL